MIAFKRNQRPDWPEYAADLRIFSYLPNPRLYKATIAARLNGVDLEVRGAPPPELTDWLWDFDAHPMTAAERADDTTLRNARKGFKGGIHKTDDFLAAHPFGTVPAAFSPDGRIGIFESNSIMRAVARLGEDRYPLYGRDAYSAARIDAFLDASLVFAIESQRYMFAFSEEAALATAHKSMRAAFDAYMGGIDTALARPSGFIVAEELTLADICFACEFTLFSIERHESGRLGDIGLEPIVNDAVGDAFPRAYGHFERLIADPVFAQDLGPYWKEMTLARIFGD